VRNLPDGGFDGKQDRTLNRRFLHLTGAFLANGGGKTIVPIALPSF
jgi:hypothetical protein